MAYMQRFKGRIAADSLSVRKGGVSDGGTGGSIQAVIRMPMPVTAGSPTADFSFAIPPGLTVLSAQVVTSVAYGAVTAANFTLGSTLGAADLVAAVNVKALGYYPLTLILAGAPGVILGNAPALVGGFNLFARITQTGGNSATGTGVLVLEYA